MILGYRKEDLSKILIPPPGIKILSLPPLYYEDKVICLPEENTIVVVDCADRQKKMLHFMKAKHAGFIPEDSIPISIDEKIGLEKCRKRWETL